MTRVLMLCWLSLQGAQLGLPALTLTSEWVHQDSQNGQEASEDTQAGAGQETFADLLLTAMIIIVPTPDHSIQLLQDASGLAAPSESDPKKRAREAADQLFQQGKYGPSTSIFHVDSLLWQAERFRSQPKGGPDECRGPLGWIQCSLSVSQQK